jgi:NodT family efflux transporter outer membrane factor (OMF) lipoprotein
MPTAKPVMPAQWISEVAKPVAGAEIPRLPWWHQFDDPILHSLVQASLEGNGRVEIARARILEARALRQGAAAERLPRLDAGGEIGRSQANENARPVNAASAQIEARWDADLFGANRLALAARDQLLEAAKAEADGVAQALAIETVQSYIELRTAQRRLAIAKRSLSAQRETMALTQSRFSAGLASALDVAQAESLLLVTQSAIPALEGEVKAALRRLETLAAVAPGAKEAILAAASGIPSAHMPDIIETPASVVAARPDLRRAERDLAAAGAARQAADAARYPTLDLRALFGVRAVSPETFVLPSQTLWSFAGALAMPLFDAGRIDANVKAADARVLQAAARYRQSVIDAFGEVEAALALLIARENERVALARAVESSRQTLGLADERYRRGLAGFIDVLDAQRGLYQAEDRLALSEAMAARQLVALHAALGSPTSAPAAASARPLALDAAESERTVARADQPMRGPMPEKGKRAGPFGPALSNPVAAPGRAGAMAR